MELEVQMQGIDTTQDLRMYVEHRVRFAFLAFDAPLRVRLRLRDPDGPEGQRKSCQVCAVSHAITVLVEDTHSDEYVAVGRAVERAARCLRRTLQTARQGRLERAA
jgi:ribosome-associated translation inhibitor RaiA